MYISCFRAQASLATAFGCLGQQLDVVAMSQKTTRALKFWILSL